MRLALCARVPLRVGGGAAGEAPRSCRGPRSFPGEPGGAGAAGGALPPGLSGRGAPDRPHRRGAEL